MTYLLGRFSGQFSWHIGVHDRTLPKNTFILPLYSLLVGNPLQCFLHSRLGEKESRKGRKESEVVRDVFMIMLVLVRDRKDRHTHHDTTKLKQAEKEFFSRLRR